MMSLLRKISLKRVTIKVHVHKNSWQDLEKNGFVVYILYPKAC